MGPRTELVLALVAAVLIMGQFASLVEGTDVELADCTLTDVDGVQTLVVGSNITKIPTSFCENKCTGAPKIQAIDFSGADNLTEISAMAFGNLWGNEACWELAGKLDLTNLPNLKYIGPYAFHNSKKITAVDMSNCPKLHFIGDGAFAMNVHNPNPKFPPTNATYNDGTAYDWGSLTSFVAKNVGRESLDDHTSNAETTDGPFAGALIMAPLTFESKTTSVPGGLTLLDFRGTAVGAGMRTLYAHNTPKYPTPGYFQYGVRLPTFKGAFKMFTGTGNVEPGASTYAFASLSYRKCVLSDGGTVSCCDDVNGNTFDPKIGYSAQHGAMQVGFKPDTIKRFTPGDMIVNEALCPACAANCDSCDTAGAGKCDTCSPGCIKTDDDTCEDVNGCAGNPACGADATCVDVVAPGTGYECQCDDGFLGDPVTDGAATCQAKAKCSEWSAAAYDANCQADQEVLSDTLFCLDTECKPGDTCCVARANCSTITCAAGTEANTSATSQLCAGATCATNDNDLCCQDTDGCLASPDCGTNGTCADVGAPGTGHKCRCDAGFTVTTTTDGAATCTPVQLGGAALPSTSSAAVWIVSSIFASVFAVSSSGA